MKTLFPPIFKNTIRMKSVWIFWLFALLPLVMLIAMSIDSNFLQVNSESESLSAFEYSGIMIKIVHNFVLPMIILSFIISKLFYEEIRFGILFMYKDISKTKILMAKWLTLFIIHLSFNLILFVSSIIVYYSYLVNFKFATGTFIPASTQVLNEIIYLIISTYVTQLILINIAIALSLKFSTGFSIFGTLVAYFFMVLAPKMKTAKYLVPEGYDWMVEKDNLIQVIATILIVFAIYFIMSLLYNIKKYKNIEY